MYEDGRKAEAKTKEREMERAKKRKEKDALLRQMKRAKCDGTITMEKRGDSTAIKEGMI